MSFFNALYPQFNADNDGSVGGNSGDDDSLGDGGKKNGDDDSGGKGKGSDDSGSDVDGMSVDELKAKYYSTIQENKSKRPANDTLVKLNNYVNAAA